MGKGPEGLVFVPGTPGGLFEAVVEEVVGGLLDDTGLDEGGGGGGGGLFDATVGLF